MNCFSDNQTITIYRNFPTHWNGNPLINVGFDTSIDLTGFSAIFRIGETEKTYTDIADGFSIDLTKEETGALPVGLNYGELIIVDNETHKRPFTTALPFDVKTFVSGDIHLDNYNVNVTTKIKGIDLTIKVETPSIDPEIIKEYISEHNLDEESHPYILGELDKKVDKVSTSNKVYGTDEDGEQTTYDVGSFGQVDDVQVGGVSVVQNKIASLGTMAGESASDYRTASDQDTIDDGLSDRITANTNKFSDYRTANDQDIIDNDLSDRIDDIEEVIPEQASAQNQLADKNFVNSSISTNTSNFIGTFNSLEELENYPGTVTNNDYAFVIGQDSEGNTVYNRYKYSDSTTPASWIFEYALNNSSFTANQWDAINSGATSENIGQIATNTSAIQTINNSAVMSSGITSSKVSQYDGYATSKQDTITAQNKLDSDLVDDTNMSNKFVSATDITNWNGKVDANTAITGSTKCKITYDSKGLVTAGANLSASDIPSLTLSKISDVTATASELNVLGGITASTAELNYTDGVTSNIQTQLNAKVPNTRTINGKALSSDISLTAGDVGALPSSTSIPTKTSDLTNDSGFITGINSSDVTTALGYTPYDSSNPNGYTSNVGTVTSVNNVSPTNGNVTLSIPTVNNAILTIQKNGTDVNTFTANASSNVTCNITVPTNTNELTNGAGYITLSSLSGTSPIAYNNSTGAISVASGYQIPTTTQVEQIGTNTSDISTINGKIPTQASSSNQLADKSFVNSSISTNTANFIGTFNSVAELNAYSGTLTNNDYAFVISTDSEGNTVYNRYKYTTATNPSSWVFEYSLNNSSFTANQWSAINSGATTTNIALAESALQSGDNISELNNDSGYITSSALSGYATETWVGQQGYITGITSSDVTTALGYTPYNSSNPSGYITGINSSDVTTALGYTPYNSSNPNGYTSNVGTVTSVNNVQPINGNVTISIPSQVTESTVSGWGFTKNTGTVTSVNNVSPVNGNVSLSIPSDISSNKINGAPLSNASSYFFGISDSAATDVEKVVSIPSITSLSAGQVIVVLPTVTSTVADSTIKLNNFTAYPMRYQNTAITTTTDTYVWTANTPSIFVFDGDYWRFVCQGYRQVYSAMSVSEGTTGTATTSRVMRADRLKQIIQETTLTGIDTSISGTVVATDTITEGIGKLQAQIGSIETALHTINSGS